MKHLLILILLFSIACSPTSKTTKPLKSNKKKVFLFAGQSNMEGRANGDLLSEEDLKRLEKVAPNIAFHYNHFPVTPLQLTTPKPYIQKKFSLEKSFGPELFFGINLVEKYPKDEFVFIKRSQGGTSLYGCWNPDWTLAKAKVMNEEKQPKLFTDFVNYGQSILANMDTSEYEICGMLWVQGESDSGIKKHGTIPAETYGQNLQNLIKETRKQFNVPNLPIMIFQVGSGKVVEGMKSIAKSDDFVFLIKQSKNKKSTNYYERNPPPIGHYTAKSMKKIGERFFETYERDY
ncbi:MAG: sialate O-acetylesterase [Saprospiraceae bacterium]